MGLHCKDAGYRLKWGKLITVQYPGFLHLPSLIAYSMEKWSTRSEPCRRHGNEATDTVGTAVHTVENLEELFPNTLPELHVLSSVIPKAIPMCLMAVRASDSVLAQGYQLVSAKIGSRVGLPLWVLTIPCSLPAQPRAQLECMNPPAAQSCVSCIPPPPPPSPTKAMVIASYIHVCCGIGGQEQRETNNYTKGQILGHWHWRDLN